jgi:hypothetical protein
VRRSVIKEVSMTRPGACSVAADCIPEVLICVTVKARFALKKVMATVFMEADDGSWWA